MNPAWMVAFDMDMGRKMPYRDPATINVVVEVEVAVVVVVNTQFRVIVIIIGSSNMHTVGVAAAQT
jgi:hypothetical protein